MKVFTGILCFYVFALTTLPCIDVIKDKTLHPVELTQNTAGSRHTDGDLCSPFCACNCCVSPVIHQDNFSSNIPFLLSQDYNSGYAVSCFSSPTINIWQPPKIG